jgi:uncharacterized membrane protein YtjA (UPF0391 family)
MGNPVEQSLTFRLEPTERNGMSGVVNATAFGLSVWQSLSPEDHPMLGWALTFLVIAVVAALFGFGVIASASAGIAQFIFFAFIVLFVLSLVFGFVRSPPV